MAATLQQLPTTFLMLALYDNPSAQTFPWNLAGQSGDVTRTQVLTELSNRSGQNDSSQIVSAKTTPVGTTNGSPVVNGKMKIK